jgi:Phage integrase family
MSEKTCARCGRRVPAGTRWPDGVVCWTCHDRALRIRGRCPGCQHDGALPGRRPDGTAICSGCAGFRHDYTCARCGTEDKLHSGKLCTRCAFSDQLTGLLDDGTGRVRPELVPLKELLLSMQCPLSGLSWLCKPQVRPLLRSVARGEIALTHDAFHAIPAYRAGDYLRDLLMACGVLPRASKHVLIFERWLLAYLDTTENPGDQRILRYFATWYVLPRLRRQADRGSAGYSARRFAGEKVKQAASFLAWLAAHETSLGKCSQADTDTWHATHSGNARQKVRGFLQWAMRTGRMPRLKLPPLTRSGAGQISQHQRIALIGRLLHDETAPIRARTAALIMLLYAQPTSRLVRLSITDVILEGGQVALRLGDPPSPVPEPFAALLLSYLSQRTYPQTMANPDSRWLFPGRRPGQPLHENTLRAQIRQLGVSGTSRHAAIRHLVLQVPPPVVAKALGYHHKTTTQLAAEGGGNWNSYAPGDHSR